MMSLSVKELGTYAVRISDDVRSGDQTHHHVRIVSRVFVPMRIINAHLYSGGDRTP